MVDLYWDIVDKPYQMGPQKHRLYMLDLLKEKGVKSILDVGCGTGPIYEIIRDRKMDFKYKGVDYATTFIDWAKDAFPEAEFEVQDARELKEADNSWDCVLLMHALDHVKQYDVALAEAVRVAQRYVCIILWRAFQIEGVGTTVNDRNTFGKQPGEAAWDDTYLLQFQRSDLEREFEKNHLTIEETADEEALNSGQSRYNYLFLLRKHD